MEQLNHIDVDYIESDSIAIYSDAPGVIRSLPVVLLKSSATDDPGECLVLSGGQYIPPRQLPGFQRVERKPQFRKPPAKTLRLNCDALVYVAQRPPLVSAPSMSIRERLAAKVAEWEAVKNKSGEKS
jgi:hypothetical protein